MLQLLGLLLRRLLLGLGLRLLGLLLRRRLLRARLIAHGDQQGGHVLAMVACLLESRAAALRGDALSSELYGGQIGIVVGAFDASRRIRLADFEISDDLALLVVEAAQKGPGAEKTSETAIGKGGQCTRYR